MDDRKITSIQLKVFIINSNEIIWNESRIRRSDFNKAINDVKILTHSIVFDVGDNEYQFIAKEITEDYIIFEVGFWDDQEIAQRFMKDYQIMKDQNLVLLVEAIPVTWGNCNCDDDVMDLFINGINRFELLYMDGNDLNKLMFENNMVYDPTRNCYIRLRKINEPTESDGTYHELENKENDNVN